MKTIIGLSLIALLSGCGEAKQDIFNIEDTVDVFLYESAKTNYALECSMKGGDIIVEVISEGQYEIKFNAICVEK
jgi:hypothetical protein